jgi:hypothetical protein
MANQACVRESIHAVCVWGKGGQGMHVSTDGLHLCVVGADYTCCAVKGSKPQLGDSYPQRMVWLGSNLWLTNMQDAKQHGT